MEEYENQAPGMGMPFGADKASIIEKIDPEEIVELLRKRLMGMAPNPKTGEWETNPILKDMLFQKLVPGIYQTYFFHL